MAGEDQEKTEEPTSKKIEDARKEGNVPKSQDAGSYCNFDNWSNYNFIYVEFYGRENCKFI